LVKALISSYFNIVIFYIKDNRSPQLFQ